MERTYIVTGATDGIGLAVVKGLLQEGHAVIGVARNMVKADAVRMALSSPRLDFVHADLSVAREVAAAADQIRARLGSERVLAGIVHVAGVVCTHRETTADGYERTFAVNHLAVHQLTLALLPLLGEDRGARVLVVSSRAHRWGRIHFRDVMLRHGYWLLTAYAQSKLANVLFVRDMARRIDPVAASFYAIDPGLVDTGIVAKTSRGIERWIWSWRRKAGTPAEVPAAAIVRIACDPQYALRTGLLWRDGVPLRCARRATDLVAMDRLHRLCDDLVAAALSKDVR